MGTIKIDFVRHGMTRANEQGIYCGATDYNLSPKGIEDIVSMVAVTPYDSVNKVYRSPLMRCFETANLVFPNMQHTVVDGLAEINFGKYEERKASDVHKEFGITSVASIDPNYVFPGGESIVMCAKRSVSAILSVVSQALSEGLTHIGVVTHSMVLMCFVNSQLVGQMAEEDKFMPNGMGLSVSASMTDGKLQFSYLELLPREAVRPSAADSPYINGK